MSTNFHDLFLQSPRPDTRPGPISLRGRFAIPSREDMMNALARQALVNRFLEAHLAADAEEPYTYETQDEAQPLFPLTPCPPLPLSVPPAPDSGCPTTCKYSAYRHNRHASESSVDTDDDDDDESDALSSNTGQSSSFSISSISEQDDPPVYTWPPPQRLKYATADCVSNSSRQSSYEAQPLRPLDPPDKEYVNAEPFTFSAPPRAGHRIEGNTLDVQLDDLQYPSSGSGEEDASDVQMESERSSSPEETIAKTSRLPPRLIKRSPSSLSIDVPTYHRASSGESEISPRSSPVPNERATQDVQMTPERSSSPEMPLASSCTPRTIKRSPSSQSIEVPSYRMSPSGETEISPPSSPAPIPEDDMQEDDDESDAVSSRRPGPVKQQQPPKTPTTNTTRPVKRPRSTPSAKAQLSRSKTKAKAGSEPHERRSRRNEAEINLCLFPRPPDLPCEVAGCDKIINGTHRIDVKTHFQAHYHSTLGGGNKVECIWGECKDIVALRDIVDHMRKMHLKCWWICPANIESPGSCRWKGTRDHTHVPQHVRRMHPELPWPPKIGRDTATTQGAGATPKRSCSKVQREGSCPRPPRRAA